MKHLENPRLRPYLSVTRVRESSPDGRDFLVQDSLRIATGSIRVSPIELQFLSLLDGTRTLRALQKDIENMTGEGSAPLELVRRFVGSLDQGLFLHSPRFDELVQSPIRPSSCHGVFPDKPAAFRKYMRGLFTRPGAAGLPEKARKNQGLKGILAPHIDYHRGGVQYTPAFRALYEETEATLFVIIGTSHYCGWRRFTLTRKNFQTPLGTVPTHQEYIDRLVEKVDVDLFEDEWMAHLPEHSIELEVAFLHYLFPDNPDFAIVPIVVGSFQEFVDKKKDPAKCPIIKNVVKALTQLDKEFSGQICYILSGDLAHIGPKFGMDRLLDKKTLKKSREEDQETLKHLVNGDRNGFYQHLAAEKNARNVCGLSPVWTALSVMKPECGKALSYEQYVDPKGHESVSFGSVGFYEKK